MCFSAEADFVTGAVIGAVGVGALLQVDDRRELPLAVLPMTFAVHQLTQGFVWLGLDGKIDRPTYDIALHAYLLVAWVLLPILAPLAIRLVESDPVRRRWMGVLVALGVIAGVALSWPIVTDSVTARAVGHTIRYGGASQHADFLTGIYVVATCGSFLLSSARRIQLFGVANVAAVALLAWIDTHALTSVWCSWAAIVSALIYLELRDRRHRGQPAPVVPTVTVVLRRDRRSARHS